MPPLPRAPCSSRECARAIARRPSRSLARHSRQRVSTSRIVAAYGSRSADDSATSACRALSQGVGPIEGGRRHIGGEKRQAVERQRTHGIDGVAEHAHSWRAGRPSERSPRGGGSASRSAARPRAMRSKPPRTRRIASCTSGGPSIDTTTSSTRGAIAAACGAISSPVVTSVTRMPCSCSRSQSDHRLECSSGSPPGEHHALHVQAPDVRDMPVEIAERQLALVGVGLPDVAHHAAAVAGAVHAQREDRQRMQPIAPAGSRHDAPPPRRRPSGLHLEARLVDAKTSTRG